VAESCGTTAGDQTECCKAAGWLRIGATELLAAFCLLMFRWG